MNALQIIQAGGIIATGDQAKLTAVDAVSARSYQHPAMGERVVVRLVPEMLGAAEDLKLDYYGFSPLAEHPVVGYQKRQSLGFPAWALVHDPSRASFALEVLKEWRKYARQGSSRPGNAKLGFDEIGERLGRSVPHFLPSFWEECGRLFLEVSNLNYAATYFTKARTAEKVHALKVDEDDRREAFLEFALAGAVPVKALSEYSKDLQANYSAQVAYQHFRELCLRRTLGGMPPWSSMLKELSRMAVAAGLKAADEEKAFFQEILSSPALARSPVEFWVSARSSLATLCKDEQVCQSLLDLLPKFSGNRLKHGEVWLNLLRGWNVFRVLGKQTSAAAWLSKNIGHFRSYHEPDPNPNVLFEIVRELAPQLVASVETVVLQPGWLFDLDLAELMASLKIPLLVKEPGRYLLDASRWAEGKGSERPKDPVHISQAPGLQAGLLATLESSIGTEPFESVTASQQGWIEPRRAWLASCIKQMKNQALPSWIDRLDRLEKISNRGLFRSCPELLQDLQNLEISEALNRSLRGGLLEEWSWPALEEAMAQLGKVVHWGGFFPYLVVANSHLAICVGPNQILGTHELLLPRGSQLQSILWIEDQFCVTYWHAHSRQTYWSGQPNDVRESNFYLSPLNVLTAWGSGVTLGRQWITAGSFDLQERGHGVCSDGRNYWVCEYADGGFRFQEIDPRTGKLGRVSLPSFFEDGLESDQELAVQESCMYPIPVELGCTPLGGGGGIYACRVTQSRNSDVTDLTLQIGFGLEGQVQCNPQMPAHTLQKDDRRNKPCALIALPDGTLRAVIYNQLCSLEDGYQFTNSDHDGSYWLGLPVHWWHLMRPRNLEVSLQLRRLEKSTVQAWLSGAASPAFPDEIFNQAVTKLVEKGRELHKKLLDFAAKQETKADSSLNSVQSTEVKTCLESFGVDLPYQSVNLSEDFGTVKQFFEQGSGSSATVKLASGLVLPFAGQMGVLLWRSLMPGTEPAERQAVATLLHHWLECPVSQSPDRFRLVSLVFHKPLSELAPQLEVGNSRFLLFALQNRNWGSYALRYAMMDRAFVALEHSLDGQFRLPSEADLEWERPCQLWDTHERLSSFIALAAQRGPLNFQPEHAQALAAKTGLSYAEACLLWIGLPFVDSRETNFLPTALREQLGLKAGEAKVARDTFSALSFEQRLSLFGSSLPTDPRELWDNPLGVVERLALSWGKISGVRLQVDPDCLAELNALGASLKPDAMLKILADAQGPLSKDGQCKIIPDGQMEQTPDTFESAHLETFVLYALHIGEYGSLCDPLRQPLVEAGTLIAQRLKNPDLLFLLGGLYLPTPADWENLKKSLGGAPVQGLDAIDNGCLLAVNARYSTNVYCRPSQPSHPLVESLSSRMYSRNGWPALNCFQTADFQEILAQMGLPASQGYAANPSISCPQLVDEVAQRHSLSQSAAVLYLQSLTLAAPTSKNIQHWNGWLSKEYNNAAKELTDKQLLIEAKRARAGRNHFLPGAWINLKSPHLPIERWKLPLYHLSDSGLPPLGRILAPKPLARLFAEAWARVCAGDGPAFLEVE
jgi:hypothetical protein